MNMNNGIISTTDGPTWSHYSPKYPRQYTTESAAEPLNFSVQIQLALMFISFMFRWMSLSLFKPETAAWGHDLSSNDGDIQFATNRVVHFHDLSVRNVPSSDEARIPATTCFIEEKRRTLSQGVKHQLSCGLFHRQHHQCLVYFIRTLTYEFTDLLRVNFEFGTALNFLCGNGAGVSLIVSSSATIDCPNLGISVTCWYINWSDSDENMMKTKTRALDALQ